MMMEAWQELASGIIMMIVLGPAVGNYATSVVYRLPLGQTPFEKNPYCGNCDHYLQPRDLFPILSYLSLKGRCRYCGFKIRPTYMWVEVACGILFVIDYLVFGVSEAFILVTALGVFLVTLCALEYHEHKLFTLILTYLYSLAALFRVLQEHTIYGFFFSAFLALFLAVCWWRLMVLLKKAAAKKAPDYVWLAVLLGMALPVPLMVPAAALALLLYGIQRLICANKTQSFSVTLALYAALIYQQLIV